MSKCQIKECYVCNIKNVIHVNKSLLSKISPIYLSSDLYNGLELPELRSIVINYICELNKIYVNRSDFIDLYVGWTAIKTKKLLEFNRNKIIIINDTHSLVINDGDAFGKEAINTIKSFISQNNDGVIIFN